MQKIKLKKALWNKAEGDELEVDKLRADFAIRKGYAEKVDPEQKTRKDKVDPEVKQRKTK